MGTKDIKVEKTNLPGALLIKPEAFTDFRGSYLEIFNEENYRKIFKENGIPELKFIQDDTSVSFKNVLRGFHGDAKTWKLISCLRGEIYAVILNCDEESKDFGKWQAFTLSGENRYQLLVPPKHGNSFLVISEDAVYHYKQTTYYDPINLPQFTYKWNDPRFNVKWPIDNPILSNRDQ